MKSIPFLFLIFSIIITSCNHDAKKSALVKRHKQPTRPDAVDTNKILLSRTHLHAFSDQSKLDTFKLIIRGSSINTGSLKFEIISYKNEKIYNENYSAVDLLGDLDDLSAKESEDTIKSRFSHFFNPDDFYTPALDRKLDLTDTDYVDIKTQKDISADPTAIGFIYSIGYETSLEIAYSKKQKKTLVCYASD
jgi:hypothetical protein